MINLVHQYIENTLSFDAVKTRLLETHTHLMANGADRPEKVEYLK